MPSRASALSVYDNYDAWSIAVNAPITAACTSGPACFATSPFGVPQSAAGFSGPDDPFQPNAWVSDDMDFYRFGAPVGAPAVAPPIFRAVAFSGTGFTLGIPSNPSYAGQRIFGLNVLGMTFMNTTGFLGFVDNEPFRLSTFSSASRTASFITAMFFDSASAPGFKSTVQAPEPAMLIQLVLGLALSAMIALYARRKKGRV